MPVKKSTKKQVKKKIVHKSPVLTKYPDINLRFKKTREESGMTIEEFANALGTTSSTVKQIEYGRNLPNFFILVKWKKKFRKSYEWILEGGRR